MRRNTNQVEIKGPPIGELKKKKSCLLKTCLSGGCLIVFILMSLLVFKFVTEPRIKELKELPKKFTEDIPIYDEKNIQKIEFLSSTYQKDSYRIEWTELPAQPSFIQNYYKTELKKRNFTIDISSGNEVVNQFTFKKDNISGVLYIKDDLIKEGTDYILLIVNMPSK